MSLSDVEKAVTDLVATGSSETESIQVVSLQPERLANVWANMARVAAALDNSAKSKTSAAAVIERLKERLQPIEAAEARLKVA